MLSDMYTQAMGQRYFWTPRTLRMINLRISSKFYKSSLYTLIGRQHFSFIVNSILILLHLETVPECTTLIDSIMASTLRARSGWQSDMTSSVLNNPWPLSPLCVLHGRAPEDHWTIHDQS
jgi:hypothetical protein